MWRRVSVHLRTISPFRSVTPSSAAAASITSPSTSSAASRPSLTYVSRHFTTESENVVKKKVDDVMPIATGHEREEHEAELEGRDLLDINYPVGPFGTKRMSMMSFGSGLRRANRMNVQYAHNILCWKLLALEDLLMDMVMMMIIITRGVMQFSWRNNLVVTMIDYFFYERSGCLFSALLDQAVLIIECSFAFSISHESWSGLLEARFLQMHSSIIYGYTFFDLL